MGFLRTFGERLPAHSPSRGRNACDALTGERATRSANPLPDQRLLAGPRRKMGPDNGPVSAGCRAHTDIDRWKFRRPRFALRSHDRSGGASRAYYSARCGHRGAQLGERPDLLRACRGGARYRTAIHVQQGPGCECICASGGALPRCPVGARLASTGTGDGMFTFSRPASLPRSTSCQTPSGSVGRKISRGGQHWP